MYSGAGKRQARAVSTPQARASAGRGSRSRRGHTRGVTKVKSIQHLALGASPLTPPPNPHPVLVYFLITCLPW